MKIKKILFNIIHLISRKGFFTLFIILSISIFTCLTVGTAFNCSAQIGGAAINATGNAADNSAMLDVSSTAQGMLVPRMTTVQRDSIAIKCSCTPAQGLQIYNTTTQCFEFYANGVWQTAVCGCSSAPAAAGTISGTATVCPGQNAVLYSVPAIARATNYIWSYSGTGAFIVGSTNAVIVYFSGAATSGNLTVLGTNACGNGDISADYPIAVNSTAPNITAQPVSAATCFGSGAVSFTVTATGGLTYQWQEFIISWNNVANAGVYSNVNTAILTITNPPLSMNANKYRCVVSGTCTNTTSDGEATLSVNPIPLVTNAATTTTCSGTGPNISLTSSLPSNFSWTIGTITGGITGASASSGVTINQTLINPSNDTAGSIQYIVTPTSTAGSCVGAAFTITVTVNPTPTVTNTPLAQSICLGGNTTLVTLTSNVSGTTFAWTASATSGVSGFTTSGSGTIPVQTIYTSASTAGTVTYAITPTANGCAGSVTNYVTTVNLFATGGTITYTDASGLNPRSSPPYSGGYTVHTFTSSGTFTSNCSGNVEVLVVAGGGGGAGRHGGGGGAGGLIYNSSFAVTAQAYATTIGAGGNGSVDYATNGSNSVFGSLTAIGGARGRTYGPGDAQATGGSGGGGAGESPDSQSPNLGTSGQGNNGGQASSTYEAGGGGGGAGAAGGNASVKNGGAGGNGLAYSISGTSKYYAGGGGGGASGVSPYGTAGAAGLGGGGRGGDGYTDAGVTAGTPNTGGGGGASRTYSNVPGAGGGSGIVIIRYHN